MMSKQQTSFAQKKAVLINQKACMLAMSDLKGDVEPQLVMSDLHIEKLAMSGINLQCRTSTSKTKSHNSRVRLVKICENKHTKVALLSIL